MLTIISNSIKIASYDHSSTQINLSTVIANQIIKWGQKKITDVYNDPGEPEKYGLEKEIHCTIKYGLLTINSEEVRKKIKGFGKFSILLGKISRFVPKEKPYDVVKLAVESKKLEELHSIIGELPNDDEHPTYNSHITVAYIKSGTNVDLSGDGSFVGQSVHVSEIIFSPKNGGKKVTLPL